MAPMKKQYSIKLIFAIIVVIATVTVVAKNLLLNRLVFTSIEIQPGESERYILSAKLMASRHHEIVNIVAYEREFLIVAKDKDVTIAKKIVTDWLESIRLEHQSFKNDN